MVDRMVEMSEDEFEAGFPLLRNHLDPDASWSLDDSGGCLFETFGPELEFVCQQDPRAIWTLIDCDGEMVLSSGLQLVNRVGYLVSTALLPVGANAIVRIRSRPDD